MSRVTFFTPSYNRAATLCRIFNSLMAQTCRDFTWLIIDDGSTDDTLSVVEKFRKIAVFPIAYVYQENGGKHSAMNHAVSLVKTDFLIIADSDDEFVPVTTNTFIRIWESIPEEKKECFCGVCCRCIDQSTGKMEGRPLPQEPLDISKADLQLKLRLDYEACSMYRTAVLKEFPFPEPPEHLPFFPETVVWHTMAKKYILRCTNDCLRVRYHDQGNSVTKNKSYTRHRMNIYLWEYYVNNELDYFRYYPMRFVKSFVGFCRDGILCGYSYKMLMKRLNTRYKKAVTSLFYPAGWILAKYAAWDGRRNKG